MKVNDDVVYFDFNDFRLDLMNECLLINGKTVHLTNKAFQTLLLLVENHGRVVEKDEIFSKLWSDSFVEETNLTQYIYILRRILEQSSSQIQYIETIPKRGYRFNGEVIKVSAANIEAQRTKAGQNGLIAARNNIFSNRLFGANGFQSEPEINNDSMENEITVKNNRSALTGFAPQLFSKRLSNILPFRYFIVFVTVIVLLLLFAGYFLRREQRQAAFPASKSIAVLPFKAIGDDSRDEKLGLGMADAVIVRLSKLQQIPVRPTSAVFRFTDQSDLNALEIGKELGVDTIMEGTVQREGERMRVCVQLVRVADGKALWAGSFDEKFSDIFTVQDVISSKVAHELSLNLNTAGKQFTGQRTSDSIQAYQEYLLGVYFWNKRTGNGLQKAVEHFNRAIEIDRNYASAYAGLADTFNMQCVYAVIPCNEANQKAKESALKALGLDETVAQAHIALANFQLISEKNYWGGRRSLERAIELEPYNATARLRYAWVLLRAKQLDDAVREMRLAQEYDPLSAISNAALCGILIFKRDYDEAVGYCTRAAEINPETPTVSQSLAKALFFKGEKEQAIIKLENFTKANPSSYPELGTLGYFYAKTGRKSQAEQISAVLLRQAEKDSPRFYKDLAVTCYALGQKDKAFIYLKSAISARTLTNLSLFDPSFDDLRSDPQYEFLIKSLNYKDAPDEVVPNI